MFEVEGEVADFVLEWMERRLVRQPHGRARAPTHGEREQRSVAPPSLPPSSQWLRVARPTGRRLLRRRPGLPQTLPRPRRRALTSATSTTLSTMRDDVRFVGGHGGRRSVSVRTRLAGLLGLSRRHADLRHEHAGGRSRQPTSRSQRRPDRRVAGRRVHGAQSRPVPFGDRERRTRHRTPERPRS